MSDGKVVLVIGATGRQGGAIARKLLERGVGVRALTRKPGSPAGTELQRLGVDVRLGDLDDRASIGRAAEGVDSVFSVTTPYEAGMEAETRQGIAVANAAKEAGVEHLVYSSVGSADRATGISHFESKHEVERHIADLGIPFTVIGPVSFFENINSPWQLPALQQGMVVAGFPPDKKVQHVAVADIASFAVHVLERPDEFSGRRIDIASDAVSGTQQVETLSRVTGREIRYVQQSLDEIRGWGGDDLALMVEWIDGTGYDADIGELRRAYPEIGWHSLETWATEQDWGVLDAPAGQAWEKER